MEFKPNWESGIGFAIEDQLPNPSLNNVEV